MGVRWLVQHCLGSGGGGHKQETKRVSFLYLLSSPFPISFSFFDREMKTDIIQYWLEMVHVEMNILSPLFPFVCCLCGKEWHGLRGYKKWLEREFVSVFIEVGLWGNGGVWLFPYFFLLLSRSPVSTDRWVGF